jgi:hypothetical protein
LIKSSKLYLKIRTHKKRSIRIQEIKSVKRQALIGQFRIPLSMVLYSILGNPPGFSSKLLSGKRTGVHI